MIFKIILIFSNLLFVFADQPIIGGCKGTLYGCCHNSSIAKFDINGTNCNKTNIGLGGCAGTEFGCCHDGKTDRCRPNHQ